MFIQLSISRPPFQTSTNISKSLSGKCIFWNVEFELLGGYPQERKLNLEFEVNLILFPSSFFRDLVFLNFVKDYFISNLEKFIKNNTVQLLPCFHYFGNIRQRCFRLPWTYSIQKKEINRFIKSNTRTQF